jgi:hypothetical protein
MLPHLRKSILLLALLLSFGLVDFAHAAVPTIIGYQGRLTNSSGDLLGGSGTSYYFKFSIWNNATVGQGTKLWPTSDPTAFTTTVRQGVFNVNIGDTANGYPDALNYNFSASSVYLQVEVSSNGSTYETLSPRQLISSVAFAQVAGAVSGTGQSSFGTTSPASSAVVTIEATTTTAIPLLIRGVASQSTNLMRVEDSLANHLFSINPSGGIFGSSTILIASSTSASAFIFNESGDVGIGTRSPARRLSVNQAASAAQFRVSQTNTEYGEYYVDSTGDVQFSSTGGNIRNQNENVWVCSGGSCGVDTPVDKGNLILETALIFNNKFKVKQVDASTTIMYDSIGQSVLEFDEGQ